MPEQLHPWTRSLMHLVRLLLRRKGMSNAAFWEGVTKGVEWRGPDGAVDLSVQTSYENLSKYINIGQRAKGAAHKFVPWHLAVRMLSELGVDHLTVRELAGCDLYTASRSKSGGEWLPDLSDEKGLHDYTEKMKTAQDLDPGRRYRIFGLTVTFAVMTKEACQSYCRAMYNAYLRTACPQPPPVHVPTVEQVCDAYEMLRFEIEKSYKSFNEGYRPQIDNYIPESSLEAILDLGNPLFGEPRARIAMLELILERCELKAKPYRLHLLDDFALRADPELASLISNSETILLVGGGEPLASNNDFTCGSFCSRRDRAFRIKWSTSRERVAEARRVFERLGNLSPPARQVTASEIGKAISALKGRIKKRRIS